jgi:geranylgeranyl pyrophosphate synthase
MDITEGKLTLIVIHALRKANPSEKEELLQILMKHTIEEELRMQAIRIIRKQGSIEYAKRRAVSMVRESWGAVDKILRSSKAKESLRLLANYLINRDI